MLKKTRNAIGKVWQYENSAGRGITWAAEITVSNALFCAYGQKNRRFSIAIANKYARRMGWKLIESWQNIERGRK